MWTSYRLGQAIPRDHVQAIKQGRYQLKGHGQILRVVNEEIDFAFRWNFVRAFVLVKYIGIGMVAIHKSCLEVEYPNGTEQYLELHVDLDGGDLGPRLHGSPILFYNKWFRDGSVNVPMPDGDLAATGELPENWKVPDVLGQATTGAWRFTLHTGQVIRQRVDFKEPFPTVPGVTASIISRNLPSTTIDEISLRTADSDTHGFTFIMTAPETQVWVRCVVGWEAVEFRSHLDKEK